MQLVGKVLAVLAVLALATPALACGDKTNTKSAETKQTSSKTVAKAEKKKAAPQAKHATEAKPASASN